MSTIQKIAFGIIVGSFFVNAMLWVNGYGANREGIAIQSEINNTEQQIQAIESTFPSLNEHAQKVLDIFSGTTIIPEKGEKGEKEWYARFFNGLHIGQDIKMTYTVKGRKIPYGMETPWNMRQFGRVLYPTIVPSIVNIKFTGSLPRLTTFLHDMDWCNPYVIVRKVELHANQKDDLYNGTIDLVMPQLYYEKDLQNVQEFVKKMTSKEPDEL